eukprot:783453_1
MAALYNLLYRFSINTSDCPGSDVFEELIISFSRSILLLFYVIMIYKIFENSQQEIRRQYIYGLILIIIIFHMIILPAIYISTTQNKPIKTQSYGIYCSNWWNAEDFWSVVLYVVLDFSITVFLCTFFVFKLYQLHSLLNYDESDDDKKEEERLQQHKNQRKLFKLAQKTLILTSVSIVSSWVVIFLPRFFTK